MIKYLGKSEYLVNDKKIDTSKPSWGVNLSKKEYDELQKVRLLTSKKLFKN